MRNSKNHRKNSYLVDNQRVNSQKQQIMEATHITPTKENPVFIANCDWFGNIGGIYKDYLIDTDKIQTCGQTFALSYSDAINKLHEWIKENTETLEAYPKCKFEIFLIDGTIDTKWNLPKQRKVYTISAKNAKAWLF